MSADTVRVSAASARPEVVVRPPSGWATDSLRELVRSRELLYFLTKRELQVRYKQSILGAGWALLQPLSMTAIFALFFGYLARIESDGFPYPVFALTALVPWLFVSGSVSQAASSLVADASLVSKVYFPRLVIPIARVLALLVDLAIALVVLLAIAGLYGIVPSPELAVLPAFLLLAFAAALGAAILLSALNAKYRDVVVAVPLIVQLWLFASPVVYPSSLIPEGWQAVYALNPMTAVIDGARWAVLGAPAPAPEHVLISAASAVALLAVGIVYFRRSEHAFADLI